MPVTAAPDNGRQDDAAAVLAAARAGEPDRYLSALLAPQEARPALLALAAFSAEIRRIPLLAREPAMAAIRAQWWRDALTLPAELRTGNPVADAVRAAARASGLPGSLLEGVIDGFTSDADAADAGAWLGTHVSEPEGCLFALAARSLGVPAGAELDAACKASGHAYGTARLLLDLPGRSPGAPLPRDGAQDLLPARLPDEIAQIRRSLGAVRPFVTGLPRAKRTAFLPLALVETYLRAVERGGERFLREGAGIWPLARVSRIAVAHLLGP